MPLTFTIDDDEKLVSLLERVPDLSSRSRSNSAMNAVWNEVWEQFKVWWEKVHKRPVGAGSGAPTRQNLPKHWTYLRNRTVAKAETGERQSGFGHLEERILALAGKGGDLSRPQSNAGSDTSRLPDVRQEEEEDLVVPSTFLQVDHSDVEENDDESHKLRLLKLEEAKAREELELVKLRCVVKRKHQEEERASQKRMRMWEEEMKRIDLEVTRKKCLGLKAVLTEEELKDIQEEIKERWKDYIMFVQRFNPWLAKKRGWTRSQTSGDPCCAAPSWPTRKRRWSTCRSP